MKKVITFILSVFALSFSVSAQHVRLGVETGANLSHFKSSGEYHAQKKGGMGAGFQIGGTVDYEFKHHWMLMSGVSFMQTKSNMKLADNTIFHFPDTEIKLNHLMLPIKIGYNISICKGLRIAPFIGIYGSYNFNAGSSSLKAGNKTNKWKPMNGYSYSLPNTDITYDYKATIKPFSHWTYGAMVGVKAVVADHYTISFQYNEAIKEIQNQCNLRNYGYQLSVGYQF